MMPIARTTYSSNGQISGAGGPSSFIPRAQVGRTVYTSGGQVLEKPVNQEFGSNYGPNGYLSSNPGINTTSGIGGVFRYQNDLGETVPGGIGRETNGLLMQRYNALQPRPPALAGQQVKYTRYMSSGEPVKSTAINLLPATASNLGVPGVRPQWPVDQQVNRVRGLGALFGLQKSPYGGVIA